MDDLESIKVKVKKLLALSKSPNENEACAALKKANELMAEYKLTFEQMSHFVEQKVKSTKKLVLWRVVLSNAVEQLYATCHYSDNFGHVVFVGDELDVFMATEMYKYLSRTIDRMARQNIRKNAKQKYRLAYRTGIASCLYDRITTLGQQCSWRNPEELESQKKLVKDFLNRNLSLSEGKNKFAPLNSNAFGRGLDDGKGIGLNRQMTADRIKRIGV